MNGRALSFQVVFWTLLYLVWLFTTSDYHPTWALRVLATACLTLFSAIFAFRLALSPLNPPSIVVSVLLLIVCGAAAALSIHGVYDVLWGPDPRRFALSHNIVMDTSVVLFNTIIALVISKAWGYFAGGEVWRIGRRGPRAAEERVK